MKAFVLIVVLVMGIVAVPRAADASDARRIVEIVNTEFGGVCQAELEGFFSKTLKLDWTARTNKLHVMIVLKNIADAKARLYGDGVRYLKIPNDAGGYNVFDWKTGEKSSVRERAPYYFRD